jgi:pathogenesis-related protein 1
MKNISTLLLSLFSLSFIACGGNATNPQDNNNSRALQNNTQNNQKNNEATTPTQNPLEQTQPNPIMITKEQKAVLKTHNDARAAVGISHKLTWSDTIASDAQSYANTLAQNGAWEHDTKNDGGYANGPYGENLYVAYSSSGEKPSWEKAARSWINEKAFYHYGSIGDSATCDTGKVCGHYTQVVWKDTTQVGCATALYKTGFYKDWYLIVCKYKTPGNVRGQTPY